MQEEIYYLWRKYHSRTYGVFQTHHWDPHIKINKTNQAQIETRIETDTFQYIIDQYPELIDNTYIEELNM